MLNFGRKNPCEKKKKILDRPIDRIKYQKANKGQKYFKKTIFTGENKYSTIPRDGFWELLNLMLEWDSAKRIRREMALEMLNRI